LLEGLAVHPPRILLIGKIGQVGWELRRALAPMPGLTAVDFPEIDLASADSMHQWVRQTRPRIIINAAAYTAVDKAESEPGKAMKINGEAPGILAEEARRVGALLVHYSTDYVFDGAKSEPYTENDAPNPLGVYGRSKLAGDEAVRAVGGSHLIFRLCWVYGARGQNFMLTMMRLAREREKLRVVSDQVGCPTWSRMIAQTTALALKEVVAVRDWGGFSGTYHLAASGTTSWHGFAQAIVNLMPGEGRKCAAVEAISTAEYPTPAKRPAYSVLNCDKLQTTFGLRLPGWEESLKQVLEDGGLTTK
jgi:dTDP-4-dehydrorhamnose reductase